jgi:predicted glycoside hydrolase/deacetylase ChbG (UPF0249 family)
VFILKRVITKSRSRKRIKINMCKKLIFNVDDFGLSKGVNLGVIEAYENGPVRSTTIMAGGAAFDHGVALARENPGLKVGIHLTITADQSVGGVYSTLTDGGGRFLPLSTIEKMARENRLDLDEVEEEYEAQIQKVIKAGILPSHLDSHHHTHCLPGVFEVFLKVADRYGIDWVRMTDGVSLKAKTSKLKTTDGFESGFYGDGATFENLKKIIKEFPRKSLEIMTHPAYVDNTLYKKSSYHYKRMVELDVLTSKELKEFLAKGEYEVTSFSGL